MPRITSPLPQLSDRVFLTDGGLETTLIYHDGIDLPHFAAFTLLNTADGRARLKDYYRRYAAIAREHGTGFILESATWRANPDWAAKLGYDSAQLLAANTLAITLLHELRDELNAEAIPMVISGCVGPRGDGYKVERAMTAEEAEAYHAPQVHAFAKAGVDLVSAITMTYADEAIGVTRASAAADLPVVISFTVETDGRLPSGETLPDAITAVDAATSSTPAYYMINCAHPTHFTPTLAHGAAWVQRVRGIRANASRRSHAELDASTELDAGDPVELGEHYRVLRNEFNHVTILGGCCGTDHRHVRAICTACVSPAAGRS